MRHIVLLCTALAVPAFADDKPKPNTLTPKEIEEGWILLFDGETTFGWKIDGEATAKDGVLSVGGEKKTILTASTKFGESFILHFDYDAEGKGMDVEPATVIVDWDNSQADGGAGIGLGQPILERKGWHEVHAEKGYDRARRRNTYKQTFDGTTFGVGHESAEQENPAPAQVKFAVPSGVRLSLRNIKLKPRDPQTLFNAKDLTGWKEFQSTKDKKVASKFTVTKEGWLNVKNGPGDLQTEGQWADFVLQFECISNGKHLNSGMFFRCIPDLYQQGYEAQIRNEWMGDDRTKPVDFGTGAIYRRQAARKVVSTDGEWFTMTVAAHGRHLATWVNGYQVTDWTDDRKENDNARNGFKKGKGALSIQGHDPTTDLSFRNIRIQSLDPK
jgi:hypothetical protein